MLTRMGHLRLAFAVVANVAHVLRVVFLVQMRAQEDVLLGTEVSMAVHVQHCLSLKVPDRIFGKVLNFVHIVLELRALQVRQLVLAELDVAQQLLLDLEEL